MARTNQYSYVPTLEDYSLLNEEFRAPVQVNYEN